MQAEARRGLLREWPVFCPSLSWVQAKRGRLPSAFGRLGSVQGVSGSVSDAPGAIPQVRRLFMETLAKTDGAELARLVGLEGEVPPAARGWDWEQRLPRGPPEAP